MTCYNMVIESYLCYKTITSQNVPSEGQMKNNVNINFMTKNSFEVEVTFKL